jgi:hypothetical protein
MQESLMGTVAATVAEDAKVQDTAAEVVAAAAKASGAYWTAARSVRPLTYPLSPDLRLCMG